MTQRKTKHPSHCQGFCKSRFTLWRGQGNVALPTTREMVGDYIYEEAWWQALDSDGVAPIFGGFVATSEWMDENWSQ